MHTSPAEGREKWERIFSIIRDQYVFFHLFATGYYTYITIPSVTMKYAPVSFLKHIFGAENSKTAQPAQNMPFLTHKGNGFAAKNSAKPDFPPCTAQS